MLKKKNTLFVRYIMTVTCLAVLSCSSSENPQEEKQPKEERPKEERPKEEPEVSLTLFSVNTDNVEIPNEPKIDASLTITTDGKIVHTGNIGIEIRGSSSQKFFPKKSYGLETWDSEGEDIDISLVGMPAEEDWILHGPYSDKTLIRNILIYDLSRDLNRYASRSKFVELNINGENKGVYVFMEKLKRNENRIDINKLKTDENSGEDLTGGYIIKIDKSNNEGYTEQNSFTSSYKSSMDESGKVIKFLYDYPKPKKITPAQKNYISTYINDFENALASPTFTDPNTGYAAYIDVDSFVDFFILNELSNNVDGYRISTYMHKDKNKKLKMGPIWDFNLAFGNADYCSGGETNVWAYAFSKRCPSDGFAVPFWWERLLEDPAFTAKLKKRWNALRQNVLADSSILENIDSYVATLSKSKAVASNFKIWPVLGNYIWPNNFIGDTYQEEIAYLKQWISARTKWLDRSIAAL